MQWSNIAGNIFQELHLKYLIHPESAREGFSTEAAHDQPQGAEADAVHGFLLRSTDVVDSVGGNIITELLKLVDHLFQHRVILHLNALHATFAKGRHAGGRVLPDIGESMERKLIYSKKRMMLPQSTTSWCWCPGAVPGISSILQDPALWPQPGDTAQSFGWMGWEPTPCLSHQIRICPCSPFSCGTASWTSWKSGSLSETILDSIKNGSTTLCPA